MGKSMTSLNVLHLLTHLAHRYLSLLLYPNVIFLLEVFPDTPSALYFLWLREEEDVPLLCAPGYFNAYANFLWLTFVFFLQGRRKGLFVFKSILPNAGFAI